MNSSIWLEPMAHIFLHLGLIFFPQEYVVISICYCPYASQIKAITLGSARRYYVRDYTDAKLVVSRWHATLCATICSKSCLWGYPWYTAGGKIEVAQQRHLWFLHLHNVWCRCARHITDHGSTLTMSYIVFTRNHLWLKSAAHFEQICLVVSS